MPFIPNDLNLGQFPYLVFDKTFNPFHEKLNKPILEKSSGLYQKCALRPHFFIVHENCSRRRLDSSLVWPINIAATEPVAGAATSCCSVKASERIVAAFACWTFQVRKPLWDFRMPSLYADTHCLTEWLLTLVIFPPGLVMDRSKICNGWQACLMYRSRDSQYLRGKILHWAGRQAESSWLKMGSKVDPIVPSVFQKWIDTDQNR